MSRKEKTINRVQKLTQSLHVIGKHSRVIEKLKRKIETEESEFESSKQRLKLHENQIQATYDEAMTKVSELGANSAVDKILRLLSLESRLHDITGMLKFVKKMARSQERQAEVNQRLILSLLSLVKRQNDLISSHAPNLLEQDFDLKVFDSK